MSPRDIGILLYPIRWLYNKSEGSQLEQHSHLAAVLNKAVQGPIIPWVAISAYTLKPNPHAKDHQGSPCIPHQCL